MTTTKGTHTPGPWRTGDRFMTIFGPPDGNPVPLTIAGLGVSHPANARLIAAAPELLEALKAFLSDPSADKCTYVNMDFVKAAVAKAEGRT